MANTSIDLVGLDFQSIKSNLKTYLKNNSVFKDVDFDSSNIGVLIDLLAYNTYLNSFYTNMVASEMFIDSAQLRDSVVSHAKSLNYTPRSFTSSTAAIDISITPTTAVDNVYIPRGTSFTSRVGSNTYTFTTNQNIVLQSSTNGVFSTSLDLYEGRYLTDSFTFNAGNTTQRFVISNPTVDIESISVSVIENNGANTLTYVSSDGLSYIQANSKVFFTQAAENQQYELKFGDNVFGRTPADGAVIVAEYRVSSGELPNGASVFVNDSNIDGHSNVRITTTSNAAGGSINESIESIRFNAPRNYQALGKAVTATDYETLLRSKFSDIQNVVAYGGETLVPPQFGKVFVSVDVFNADGTPENRIKTYGDYLKSRTPLTLEVVFIDPEFMYAEIDMIVRYNVNATTKTSNDIRTLVLAKVDEFNNTNLNGFNKTLYCSRLSAEINNVDPSILSNELNVKATKYLTPALNTNLSFDINYGFPLLVESGVSVLSGETHYGHSVVSTAFTYNGNRCILVDDTLGNLFIARQLATTVEILRSVGSVDYENGIITVTDFETSGYEGSVLEVFVKSRTQDFSSNKNVILSIKQDGVAVTVIPVKA